MKFEIKNASFGYKGTNKLSLSDVSFSAESGDIVTVLGPNGSGKTTLLRCALGFLRWKEGKTLLDGINITDIPKRELWQRVSYVPQAKHTVSPYTVEQTVLLGRTAYMGALSVPKDEDYEKADEIIEKLNISDIRHKQCSEISGGELQMVLIARALVSEPKLLVLDEPESNLDFKNQLLVLSVISSLSKEGVTCVFNTHYPSHALRYADKSLLLSADGKHIFGKSDEVVTEENINKFFGVSAVIGEIAVDKKSYKTVIPISVN